MVSGDDQRPAGSSRARRFRRVRRWYRRTPSAEIAGTLVVATIVFLAVVAGVVYLVVG